MPSNHSSPTIHWMAGKHPGKLGWLVGPSARKKTKLRDWMPYALDNDAFSAFTHGTEWDEHAWLELISWARMSIQKPMWAVVPDVVGDALKTIEKWFRFSPVVDAAKIKTAFAVQDGMDADDVPSNADVVFVGGTTAWKWRTAEMWCSTFPRVHIGRVNTLEKLWFCERIGAESVDGTGWFRDPSDETKIPKLIRWMEGDKSMQCEMEFRRAKK